MHTQLTNARCTGARVPLARHNYFVKAALSRGMALACGSCITKGWHSCRTAERQRPRLHAGLSDGNADGETPYAWAECAQAQGVAVTESVTAPTRRCAAAAAGTKLPGKYTRTQRLCKGRGPLPNTARRPWRRFQFQMKQIKFGSRLGAKRPPRK